MTAGPSFIPDRATPLLRGILREAAPGSMRSARIPNDSLEALEPTRASLISFAEVTKLLIAAARSAMGRATTKRQSFRPGATRQLGYAFDNGWRIQLDAFNLLNSNSDQSPTPTARC